jgi:hypothetical protein
MLGTGIMTNVKLDLLKDAITNYINTKHSSFAVEVRSADWVMTASVRAFQTDLNRCKNIFSFIHNRVWLLSFYLKQIY